MLTGDELINYGFRRVVEELAKLQQSQEDISKQLLLMNELLVDIHKNAQDIKNSNSVLQAGIIRIDNGLRKGNYEL